MKTIFTLIALLAVLILSSCENNKLSHIKVHTYQVDTSEDDEIDDIIFWYLINMNNGSCYYTTSSTPITNFSGVNWTQSEKTPEELEGLQETEVQEVEVNELDAEIQEEIDTTPEDFEGMTSDEMGDYEGGNESDYESGDSGEDSGGDYGDSGGDSGGE